MYGNAHKHKINLEPHDFEDDTKKNEHLIFFVHFHGIAHIYIYM